MSTYGVFVLTIKTDGAAFTEDTDELPRLLEKAADHVRNGLSNFTLLDTNGNTVGEARTRRRSHRKD